MTRAGKVEGGWASLDRCAPAAVGAAFSPGLALPSTIDSRLLRNLRPNLPGLADRLVTEY